MDLADIKKWWQSMDFWLLKLDQPITHETASKSINWLIDEVERLNKALSDGVPILEEAATRIEELESENENLQLEHDVMFCRIRDANEQYSPEEVSRIIDAEIKAKRAESV